MTSTSSRALGKRLAQALSARHYSITRTNSKGKHLPPPPPPAYGPGANSGTGSTPVKPVSTPSSPPPAKEAPKHPAGSGHVPSAASKPRVPPESLHKPEPAAIKQKTQPAPASQPVTSVLEPPTTSSVLKDPAGVAATLSPKPPSTTAPGSKPAPQLPSAGPPKIATTETKQQLKAPTAPTAPAASKQPAPQQPAPPQKPPAADAVKIITGPSPPAAAAAGGVGQDRAKQAYFAGSTGTRGGSSDHHRPPQGNAWLISKSLPVDVRLLAAGAATVGALYYFSDSRWQQQRQTQDPPPSQGGGDGGSSSGATLGSTERFDQSEQPPESHEFAAGALEDIHDSGEEELSGSDGGSAEMSAGNFYTDELAMQSKEIKEGERPNEPASTEQQSEPTPVLLPPPEPKMLKQEGIASAAKAVEQSIQNGQPVGLVDTKPVTDLLNEVGTGQWQMVQTPGAEGKIDAAYAEVDALKEVVEEADAGRSPVQHLLGLTENITAEILIKKAVERAERGGQDWAVKHENLVQARADEQTFKEVLDRAHEFQQAQLAAATAVAEASAERAEQIQAAADAAQKQFEQILEDTVRLSNLQHIQDLLRQEEFLTTAAAEAAVRERSERAAALDELRAKVNALGQAFTRRSDEQRDSTHAHQVSLGAFAMENALVRGQPYGQAASLLAQSCHEDELVSAALQALPKDSADKGLPTRAELLQRAPGVVSSTRQMAYIKPGHGGIFSLGLARLAASLKVSEGSEISGEGVDGALARMQGHLAAGRLAEAADALEAGARGSAAEKAASEWARDARARALADQTTELLQAHACSLAVSQS